jgi:hypothetical protein
VVECARFRCRQTNCMLIMFLAPVTKSVNVISWTCTQNPTYSNFTIL